jgi:hypothetical protein
MSDVISTQVPLPSGVKLVRSEPKREQRTVVLADRVLGVIWQGSGFTWWYRTASDPTYTRKGSPAHTFSQELAVRALLTEIQVL